jgi:hypothetical protein
MMTITNNKVETILTRLVPTTEETRQTLLNPDTMMNIPLLTDAIEVAIAHVIFPLKTIGMRRMMNGSRG